MKSFEAFIREREEQNKIVLDNAGKQIKRFFNIDTNVYKSKALPRKTKELLGLATSLVLRCDDCVKYHLLQCLKTGVKDAELEETFSVALVVGGSIVIPHLRRAFYFWHEIKDNKGAIDEKKI